VATWTRAVVGPAARRAGAVWIGSGIVAAVVFGGNGMQPRDLTQLAWRVPGVGVLLAVTWILLLLPTARVLVRAEGASYLRSLPHARLAIPLIALTALVVLQLPWLALWLLGDGVRGAAVVVGTTACLGTVSTFATSMSVVAKVDTVPAVLALALRRRAGDALVRGVGLAVLAGVAAGLIVRNNQLGGADAAVVGTAVITVVLVPAQVGPLLVLLDAHRRLTWLAASTGISELRRIAALAIVTVGVYVLAAAIAATAAIVAFGATPWLAAMTIAVAASTGVATTRVLVWAQRTPDVAARVVVGATVVAAIAILWIGWLGSAGVGALAATAAFAMLTTRVPNTSVTA
jgi:hypothetical protein